MEMDKLVDQMNSLEKISDEDNSFWNKYKFLIIILTCIFIFLVVFISFNFKKGLRFWLGFVGKNVRDSSVVDSPTDETGRSDLLDSDDKDRPPKRVTWEDGLDSDDVGRQNIMTRGQKRKRQEKNELACTYKSMEDLTADDSPDDHDSPIQQPSKQLRKDSDRHHAPCEILSPLKNMLP